MMSHAQNEWVQSSDFETNAKIRNAPVGTNVSSRGVYCAQQQVPTSPEVWPPRLRIGSPLKSPPQLDNRLYQMWQTFLRIMRQGPLLFWCWMKKRNSLLMLLSDVCWQSSREQLAIAEFASSLLVIPKQLTVNAARDSTELVAKLRAFHNTSQTKPDMHELRWWVW